MKLALEPLAVAANITQAADTRLDHVLVTMGSLYDFYSRTSTISDEARNAILASLEKQWVKSDQEPFNAAVYFNPSYRDRLFNADEMALRPLGLHSMLKHLYTRFFPGETLRVGDFFDSNGAYIASRGVFSDSNMCLQELQEQSKTSVSYTYIISALAIAELRLGAAALPFSVSGVTLLLGARRVCSSLPSLHIAS